MPYCFGVHSKKAPYRIELQFEGIYSDNDLPKSRTLHEELCKGSRVIGLEWISVCAQLCEALEYPHCTVKILHNDIKPDNVLLSDRFYYKSDTNDQLHRVILTDYGKAVSVSNGKRYYLTPIDQADYISHPEKSFYLAPELISGKEKQTTSSDIFSFGEILYRILDSNKLYS